MIALCQVYLAVIMKDLKNYQAKQMRYRLKP